MCPKFSSGLLSFRSTFWGTPWLLYNWWKMPISLVAFQAPFAPNPSLVPYHVPQIFFRIAFLPTNLLFQYHRIIKFTREVWNPQDWDFFQGLARTAEEGDWVWENKITVFLATARTPFFAVSKYLCLLIRDGIKPGPRPKTHRPDKVFWSSHQPAARPLASKPKCFKKIVNFWIFQILFCWIVIKINLFLITKNCNKHLDFLKKM